MLTQFQLYRKPADRLASYEEVQVFPTREAAAAATNVPDLGGWRVGGDPEVRYVDTLTDQWLIDPIRVPESDADRISLAIDLALENGQYDGDHHKMWVIDQMLRALAGDQYDAILAEWRSGEDGPNTYEWDEGVAP